jgi:hypothetical protein
MCNHRCSCFFFCILLIGDKIPTISERKWYCNLNTNESHHPVLKLHYSFYIISIFDSNVFSPIRKLVCLQLDNYNKRSFCINGFTSLFISRRLSLAVACSNNGLLRWYVCMSPYFHSNTDHNYRRQRAEVADNMNSWIWNKYVQICSPFQEIVRSAFIHPSIHPSIHTYIHST